MYATACRVWKFRSQGMTVNRIARSLRVDRKAVRSLVVPSYIEKRKARGVRGRP